MKILICALATFVLAGSAYAQQKVRINLANAFPNSLTLIGEAPVKLSKKLDRISAGTLELRVNEPGALVPALQAIQATGQGSIDAAWYYGGRASINGVEGKKLNNLGFGLTLGYTINDNLNLTVGYKSTVNDSDPGDLRMDAFMVTLVYGWHPLLEGSRRLKGEK